MSNKAIWVYTATGIILLLFISIYLCFSPHVISIDSVYGFLAYKGTVQTGTFNVLQDVSPGNVGVMQQHFVAWWSPGQWIFPGVLNYLFGWRLGIASILITFIFSLSGLFGFYKLYKYFKFPSAIIGLSLLIIIISDTFYNSFIIYQGGEILSFGVFPWFLYCLLNLQKYTFNNLLAVLLLFLLCFVAKTTLIIYCSAAIAHKIFQNPLQRLLFSISKAKESRRNNKSFKLFIPLIAGTGCIYIFYLDKGIRPTVLDNFHIELSDLLIPLSSPLSSILSVQSAVIRFQKLVFGTEVNASFRELIFTSAVFLIMVFLVLKCIYKLYNSNEYAVSYKYLLIAFYAGLSIFFIIAYAFDTNIDKSTRHFKLLGFLFIPAFLTMVLNRLGKSASLLLTFLFIIYFLVAFTYLKNKWTRDRYKSVNYFYRNYDNLEKQDRMDEDTYSKLIQLDRKAPLYIGGKPVLFFFEGNADIAIDIKHLAVFDTEKQKISTMRYLGNGAKIFLFLSKETLHEKPDFCKLSFPDYTDFITVYHNKLFVIMESE
ncbi:hypothetical protein [Agriterribacter sp.]|uniref:hypothetical protein n=1 Tax=Agriterribacter sp. TaxID=2821509 RepID=UPI002B51C154|nr:hypothetical protein [Agriterribacter sp.]HRP56395.1 hypothetical protein [Agriterribacter sp.]